MFHLWTDSIHSLDKAMLYRKMINQIHLVHEVLSKRKKDFQIKTKEYKFELTIHKPSPPF